MIEAARPAGPDDLPVLVDLAEQAVASLSGQRGADVYLRREARQPPYGPSLAGTLAAADEQVVVGTIDDVIVGYAAAAVEVLPDGSRLARVTDLYVDPGARQVGVGELLMELLMDWARASGCFGIDALALPGDRATKNFFERFGLVARAIQAHRVLDDAS